MYDSHPFLLWKHLVFIHTDWRPALSSLDRGPLRWFMHTNFDSLYHVSASCDARLGPRISSSCLSFVNAQLASQHLSALQPSPLSCLFPRTYAGLSGAIFRSHLFLVLEAPGRMNFNPTLLWVIRLSKDSEGQSSSQGSHWSGVTGFVKAGTLLWDPAGVCYCWAL